MVYAIAAVHLIAVLAVAVLTNSRLKTWLAAAVGMAISFGVGAAAYGVADALATVAGLAVGLKLIGAGLKPPSRIQDEPAIAREAVAPRASNATLQPARMFEVRDASPPRRFGRWLLVIGLVAAITLYLFRQ